MEKNILISYCSICGKHRRMYKDQGICYNCFFALISDALKDVKDSLREAS